MVQIVCWTELECHCGDCVPVNRLVAHVAGDDARILMDAGLIETRASWDGTHEIRDNIIQRTDVPTQFRGVRVRVARRHENPMWMQFGTLIDILSQEDAMWLPFGTLIDILEGPMD